MPYSTSSTKRRIKKQAPKFNRRISKPVRQAHGHTCCVGKKKMHTSQWRKKHQRITYSPEYQAKVQDKAPPLYHSDEYKPSLSEQEETQEIYDTFIDRKIMVLLRKEQEDQNYLITKLQHIQINANE